MARLQKRRLLKLAAYLEALPAQYAKPKSKRRALPGFNMNTWLNRANPFRTDQFSGNEPAACGTVACAAGHAARIPEFRKLGFKLVSYDYYGERNYYPGYKDKTGFSAVAEFFGLALMDAEILFSPGVRTTDTDPVAVAAYLRKFVETGRLP